MKKIIGIFLFMLTSTINSQSRLCFIQNGEFVLYNIENNTFNTSLDSLYIYNYVVVDNRVYGLVKQKKEGDKSNLVSFKLDSSDNFDLQIIGNKNINDIYLSPDMSRLLLENISIDSSYKVKLLYEIYNMSNEEIIQLPKLSKRVINWLDNNTILCSSDNEFSTFKLDSNTYTKSQLSNFNIIYSDMNVTSKYSHAYIILSELNNKSYVIYYNNDKFDIIYSSYSNIIDGFLLGNDHFLILERVNKEKEGIRYSLKEISVNKAIIKDINISELLQMPSHIQNIRISKNSIDNKIIVSAYDLEKGGGLYEIDFDDCTSYKKLEYPSNVNIEKIMLIKNLY